MFGKNKEKKPKGNAVLCQMCGLDCRDKYSLERHMDWAHMAAKSPVK